jgi:hypothetical protein
MITDPADPSTWVWPPPANQSLSPFESRTTTMLVWWSLLFISTVALVVCWTLWI